MGKMKDQFDEVARLVDVDAKANGATVPLHMSKLVEEIGEFAQEVNKNLGIKRKKSSDTPAVITDNIAQEAAECNPDYDWHLSFKWCNIFPFDGSIEEKELRVQQIH